MSEIITPPAHLPVTVAAADQALGRAVVEELEQVCLWRGLVAQSRRITLDGPLPPKFELEPVTALSITMWTPTDDAAVIDAAHYHYVTRDPEGTIIVPNSSWPAPQRSIGSFSINYECGWTVTPETALNAGDAVNEVPASIQLLVERAIRFRAGSGGVGDIKIGSVDLSIPDSYATDAIPPEIRNIARGYFYRPGIFSARP